MLKSPKRAKISKPRAMIFPFLIMLIITAIASLYYGSPILWTSFAIFTFVLLFDFFHFLFFSKKIVFSQSISTKLIECYGTVVLNVQIENLRGFTCIACFKKSDKIQFHLIENSCELKLVQYDIGVQNLGINYVYIKSIFGLFKSKKSFISENTNELTCFVIPIIRTLNTEVSLDRNIQSNSSQIPLYKNQYDDYIGNRNYVAGDPLKLINFKKSATIKKTVVKEYNLPEIGMMYNIFVHSYNKNNFRTIAESILATQEYYHLYGGEIMFLYFSSGYENKYDSDTILKLSSDIANIKENYENKISFSNIKTKELPTVVIISLYDPKKDYSFISELSPNSMIFLVSQAIQFKDKFIELVVNPHIIIADETMLSGVNNE